MAKVDLVGKLEHARTRVEAETPVEERGVAKFARLTRKDARIRADQDAALAALAKTLMRRRPVKTERITENTLIRVAIDLLLAHADALHGSTEDELRESVTSPLREFRTSGLPKSPHHGVPESRTSAPTQSATSVVPHSHTSVGADPRGSDQGDRRAGVGGGQVGRLPSDPVASPSGAAGYREVSRG